MDAPGNETLRLTPSKTRTAILFVAMIIWLLLGATRYVTVGGILMLALAVVGLAGAVVYGLMLLPGSSYLEASGQGLTVCTAFRKRSHAWQEIESFYVDTILARKVVKYRLSAAAPVEDGGEARVREETLPDTYGLPAQELAERLNSFRRRARMAPPSLNLDPG